MEKNEVSNEMFVSPKDVKFDLRDNYFLSMDYNEKHYERVFAVNLFPLSKKDEYISVLDEDKKEICLIKDIKEFSDKQKEIVLNFISGYYNRPEIIKIEWVKSKTNNYVLKVITNFGPREVVVESSKMGIFKVVKNEVIYIKDVSGNNYYISSFSKMDRKSKYILFPYLI